MASAEPTHRTERDEWGTQGSTSTDKSRMAGDLDAIFAAGPADFHPVVPNEGDLAALLYTSGTTADPKGVMLTHANLVGEANSVLTVIKIDSSDALLGILPMFHVLAQMANLFLPLFNGARVVYLETLNTTELLRALQERNITAFCVVPQFFYLIHERIFKELNKRGKFTLRLVRTLMALNRGLRRVGINAGKVFFGKIHATFGARMRYLVTGGSRFDPGITRDFYSFGIDVLNAYGLTETTGGAFINPPGHVVFGSVGRPFPGIEARIVDPKPVEDGAPAAGEIAIRGPIVMKGLLESSRCHGTGAARRLVLHRRSRIFRFRRQPLYHRTRQGSHRPCQRKECLSGGNRGALLASAVRERNLRNGAGVSSRRSDVRAAACRDRA